MRITPAAVALLMLASCGGNGSAANQNPKEAQAGTATPQRFDGLTIRLELESTTVQSGEELESKLIVENNSDEEVTDPRCLLGAGSHALIPEDDPDAELWLQPVVDCEGEFVMKPGFSGSWSYAGFPARTKFGDPLEPGQYLAALDIQGLTERIEIPVEVVE